MSKQRHYPLDARRRLLLRLWLLRRAVARLVLTGRVRFGDDTRQDGERRDA